MFAYFQKYSRNYRLLSVNATFRLGQTDEKKREQKWSVEWMNRGCVSRIITTYYLVHQEEFQWIPVYSSLKGKLQSVVEVKIRF